MSKTTESITDEKKDVMLPPVHRLVIMERALRTAREITEATWYTLGERYDAKEDAAVMVASILSAVDEINRRNLRNIAPLTDV